MLRVKEAVKSVACKVMNAAIAELRTMKSIPENKPMDLDISCNGSWQRRGCTSLNGFVSIISMDTGKVLDVEPMSRFCRACEIHKKYREPDPIKYQILQRNHTCKANFSGLAPNMEVTGAKKKYFKDRLCSTIHDTRNI